jgi:uncharacterized integral membrane protein
MFCPQCGQERTSESTRFCSRCGFLLTGTAKLLESGGAPPPEPSIRSRSPRLRGVWQGLFIFLLTFLVAPVIGIVATFGFGTRPWPVGLAVFILGVGGLLRTIYALMFESNEPTISREVGLSKSERSVTRERQSFLPAQESYPAMSHIEFGGTHERDRNLQPASITEATTHHLIVPDENLLEPKAKKLSTPGKPPRERVPPT